MSKAVLISIRPEWCELIASEKKTIEVRKTVPNLKTPFKCYIYCTKDGGKIATHYYEDADGNWLSDEKAYSAFLSGHVIGEFVCDRIYGIIPDENGWGEEYGYSEHDCLSDVEMAEYLGDRSGFGWHISDLMIYDDPKGLHEFMKPCNPDPDGTPLCLQCKRLVENYGCGGTILRPPQSWCYVEELP